MSHLKTVIPLAALALLLSAVPPASSTSVAAADVCTYDLIEAVAVCVTQDSTGRTCVIVYVGPSTPVNRCLNPDQVLDLFRLCAEPATIDVGVCVTTPDDYVCVTGHWGHYPLGECVYVGPAATQASFTLGACYITQEACIGNLVCVYQTSATPRVCVPDPCYTTSCWTVRMADPICKVGDADCRHYLVCVWETTYTKDICVRDPCDTTSCWDAQRVECMDRYWVHDNGAFRIESRSSCEYDVCVYDADGVCRPLGLQ